MHTCEVELQTNSDVTRKQLVKHFKVSRIHVSGQYHCYRTAGPEYDQCSKKVNFFASCTFDKLRAWTNDKSKKKKKRRRGSTARSKKFDHKWIAACCCCCCFLSSNLRWVFTVCRMSDSTKQVYCCSSMGCVKKKICKPVKWSFAEVCFPFWFFFSVFKYHWKESKLFD